MPTPPSPPPPQSPPGGPSDRFSLALLHLFLPRAERRELLDDLQAEFRERAASEGEAAAVRWLRWQALQSVPAALAWSLRRGFGRHEPPANAYRPGGRMLRNWMADARYAARRLAARPAYVVVAVATLALGIGGTAASFGIARGLLFEPLPYDSEAEIASFYFGGSWTEEEFLFLRGQYPRGSFPGFRLIAAHRPWDVTMREGDAPTRLLPGLTTSAELFEVLGARALMGRTFQEGDDVQGAEPVVVISHGLWKELGGAPTVVGSRLTLDGAPRTIVGVMPAGFWFPRPDVRVWIPRPLDPEGRNGSYTLIGRVSPGGDLTAMAPHLERLTTVLDDRFEYSEGWDKTIGAAVTPIREELIGSMRPALLATFAAMGLILLIACANVAALMLGQVESRETELAVRSALGANRRRLTQQLVVEALLLGVGAGVAGAAFAAGGFRLLARALPIGAWGESATFDWRLFAAAMALAIVAVLLVAIVPASSLWRGDLRGVLSSSRTGGIQGRGGRLERGLVVAEVALAMLIASGAALLVRSVSNLYAIDAGVETDGIAVVDVVVSADLNVAQRMRVVDELTAAFTALPGVGSAAAAMKLPLRGPGDSFGIVVRGVAGSERTSTYFRVVTTNYFETMGIALRDGRTFDVSDRPRPNDTPSDSQEVAVVVNEALAKRYFPGESAVGKVLGGGFGIAQRIVGVVANVTEARLTDEPEPVRYYLASQVTWFSTRASFAIRTVRAADADGVLDQAREAVQRVAPGLAVQETTTMSRILDVAVGPARQVMTLLTILSTLALVLGAVGIYGVIAHFADRRRRDWAIRIALGLPAWRVVRAIVGEGTSLVVAGIVLGGIGTVALARLLTSFLFGVGTLDPLAFAAASGLMLLTGVVAAFVPARRTGRVAPAVALREQ